MAGDPVIGRILDERAADLTSDPRDEDGTQDWFATRLSTHQPSGLAGSVDTGHPTLFTGVRGRLSEKGPRAVVRYSSRYEKALPNRPF